MSSPELALLSLTEVAQVIAERRFSSREVTQSCLDRIAQWQPRLNAFMAIEAEEALAAADQADAALAKGNRRGALHGVPLAHKDMYYDAGKVVTCGSKIRARFRCDFDIDRVAASERGRHDSVGLAADGGVRLWTDRPQQPLRAGA
jgi:Asp-tRNA(Asn)/Glu-tRNA(Gln) amidotransferase A subunit family amidase